ncbi:ComF family protein [Halalkalibacter urbisdiaboli]|uniref:ComF family protein n=1 Tax=Halalkalibacter urbisdiaboli TaxID=1960589 RepID=UPI000B4520D9|nr:ComF family protein [Halalkalibacter urbisdiaboli]
MAICLSCSEAFIEPPSWRTLFFIDHNQLICEACEQKLVELKGEICTSCSRLLSELDDSYKQNGNCSDCIRWEENEHTKGLLERNVSLYHYNDFLKEWLTVYKFRGDAVIAEFFADKLRKVYEKKFQDYVPVPIPLHPQRLHERGFNQSELLLKGWAQTLPLLVKQTNTKQSKLKRQARISQVLEPNFSINPDINLGETLKKVVLIDDIYTTGTTVRQAAVTLKQNGFNQVASLTIAR